VTSSESRDERQRLHDDDVITYVWREREERERETLVSVSISLHVKSDLY
jgi:hypothetical protein